MPSRPTKNKKFNGYEGMSKGNKRGRKSLFKSKRKKIKNASTSHQKRSFLNQKCKKS